MGLFNRLGSVISRTRNGLKLAVNKVKSGVGNAYNATKERLKKEWNAAKAFTSKHAETIGNIATGALAAFNPSVAAGTGLIASHFANDKTGWGRFAKGLSGGLSNNLSAKLNSQSNATNESNGHIAAGYSISSTGNNTKPLKRYNGKNRMKSWVL